MKKIIAVILAVALVTSLFVINSSAYGTGNSCCDFVWLYDEAGNTVADFGATARDLGDISSFVKGKGAKYIHLQGWYSDDNPIEDMGYSINGGDVVWGCGIYDENLVAVKHLTLHEYPYRYKFDAPIIEGEDVFLEIWYKLEDGEEDVIPGGMEFTYSNVSTGERYITLNFATVKYFDDEVQPRNLTIDIKDAENSGKDWLGVVSSSSDLDALGKEDIIGWWSYVTGDVMTFNSATFKQSNAEDLVPGDYYMVLFENDGYNVINYQKFSVGTTMDDYMHFDGTGVIEGESFSSDDFGDISLVTTGLETFRFFGWFASDLEIASVGYRYADGTEEFAEGKARSDAAAARQTLFGMGFDFNVPIKGTGDQELDFVVKFADGTEDIYKTFYYYCDASGSTKAPTATPSATNTPAPTDTPKPTDIPATDAPATDAPATEVPATDAPAEEKKSGCGSVLVSGFAVITLVGAALLLKKKEN